VKRCWEIIADNLSKAGWTWGCVATVDREGRTIWIADAHRDNGKRFVVPGLQRDVKRPEKLCAVRPKLFVKLSRSPTKRSLRDTAP
jgi:5-formyltetrahydrofolate cyclo-ligase